MTELRPLHRRDLAVMRHGDEAHLADLDTGQTHVLNATAFAIWELCDGETDIETMAGAVAEVTMIDFDQAVEQVRATVDLLRERGLVD